MNIVSEANQRWHLNLDTSYQAALESLTALEFKLARQHWQTFKRSLIAHIEFEQTLVEPLTASWENNTLKLIRSDHLILKRLLPRLDAALDRIEQANSSRSELIKQLGIFIKLRNVLEHHDVREMENLYPALDEKLDINQAQALADEMDAARTALTA